MIMTVEKITLLKALKAGIAETDLLIAESMQTKIIDYLALLQKWNAVHNLTAVRDPLEMIPRHVLDSLILLPSVAKPSENSTDKPDLAKPSIIDVGTGAGLPGLLLAICLPDQKVTMLDSNQNKIKAFLNRRQCVFKILFLFGFSQQMYFRGSQISICPQKNIATRGFFDQRTLNRYFFL